MKNPKGEYNENALNDLLKQYMLNEAAGDRTANEWLETEAEAVFAGEPEHVPAKEKEAALIAALNEKMATGSKGGGLIWKGSALGILLVGVITATIMLWPETEQPVVTNESIWTDEGYQNAHFPYYDGSAYIQNDTSQQPDKSLAASNIPDNAPIERLVVRHDDAAVTPLPDTSATVASKPTSKPKNATKTLLRELRRRLETFNSQFPAERVYAQTDRTDYLPGQTLWFTAYVLNEDNLKASTQSDIIKTEILNSSGEPVALKEWIVTNGRVTGDLPIPQGLASGTYIFRAYTAWQHYLPGKIFEAPIVIQQPGQTLRMDGSAVTKQPKIEFFPEGGDLVAGLESRVAFTVSNYQGPIRGAIIDANSTEVATFVPNAEGQGVFSFTPQANMSYFATINEFAFEVPLPKVYTDGYVLEVAGQQGAWVKANIKSTKEANVVLVGQLRGEMYYGTELELKPGNNPVNIPTTNLPVGVLHLSLFDAEGVGHAERLVFVNKQKQLHVSIVTDKTNYLPREKVTAYITVTDDKGKPVQTSLSLSASDELLTHTQNTNILSALLLEPDLGGVVHHAGYLFDPSNKDADKEIDLLLMTSGWRRFTWKEVYYGLRKPIAVSPENAILKGKVIDAETRKPLKDVKITNKLLGIKTSTAADGSFLIPNLDLTQLRELDFTYKVGVMTLVVNHYQNDLVLEFEGDARKVYQPQANSRQHPVLTGNPKAAKGTAIAGQVLNAYGNGVAGATVTVTAADGTLQQLTTDNKGYYLAVTEKPGNYKVAVKAAGYNSYENPAVKTSINQLSMLDVLLSYQVHMGTLPAHFNAHQTDTFANRYSFLAGKFDPSYNSPAEESGKNPLLADLRGPLRDGVTAYYMEGMKMRYNEPMMLPLSAIGHMEVFDHGLPSKYNDASGTVMEVTTGVGGTLSGTPKAPADKSMGFHIRYAQPREYPKTTYGLRDKGDSRTDLRSTLYWNGNIATDGNGKAMVEFYTSDDLSAFRLVVEGIGSNGTPGRTEQVVGMAWPFDLHVRMPETLKKGEKVQVYLNVENYTGKQITGNFDFSFPAGLKPIWPLAPKEHSLFPQRSDTIAVQFEVIDPTVSGTLIIGYTANGYRDVFTYALPPVGKREE